LDEIRYRCKVGSLELGFLELGSLELGSLELGSLKDGFLELGSLKDGFLELGFPKVGSLELGSPKGGSLEIRAMQIKALTLSVSNRSCTPSDDGENRLDIRGWLEFMRTFLCFLLSRRFIKWHSLRWRSFPYKSC